VHREPGLQDARVMAIEGSELQFEESRRKPVVPPDLAVLLKLSAAFTRSILLAMCQVGSHLLSVGNAVGPFGVV
jgi:hypothetical protein